MSAWGAPRFPAALNRFLLDLLAFLLVRNVSKQNRLFELSPVTPFASCWSPRQLLHKPGIIARLL
jgi:hypothetical protein